MPGLRREEVALLAGVSVAWYTRFETGEPIRMSSHALGSIADALRLSDEEKLYLFSLAIDEMPTVARFDIVGAGSAGIEYQELSLLAKRARCASDLPELEELVVDFLFRLNKVTDTAYFVHADLDAERFRFTTQLCRKGVALNPTTPQPFTAIHDSEPVLVRGEIFAQNNLEESPHEIFRRRARELGTGRYISAGIKAAGRTMAIGYTQMEREEHSAREKYLLGLVAELVSLALDSRN